jgi:hypothetical protein
MVEKKNIYGSKSVKKIIGKKLETRKSPAISASTLKEGTIKKGLDGKKWIIKKSENGVKRWIPAFHSVKTAIANEIKTDAFFIQSFPAKAVFKHYKPLHIGKLNITSTKIGLGEIMYNEASSKKGMWNIYYCQGSLIAIHESTKLTDMKFVKTKYMANCDLGMFAFMDIKSTKKLSEENQDDTDSRLAKKYLKKNIHLMNSENIIKISNKTKIKGVNAFYVYENDLIDKPEEKKSAKDNKKVAIFAENMYGDGSFSIYRAPGAYWIMSNIIENYLWTKIPTKKTLD